MTDRLDLRWPRSAGATRASRHRPGCWPPSRRRLVERSSRAGPVRWVQAFRVPGPRARQQLEVRARHTAAWQHRHPSARRRAGIAGASVDSSCSTGGRPRCVKWQPELPGVFEDPVILLARLDVLDRIPTINGRAIALARCWTAFANADAEGQAGGELADQRSGPSSARSPLPGMLDLSRPLNVPRATRPGAPLLPLVIPKSGARHYVRCRAGRVGGQRRRFKVRATCGPAVRIDPRGRVQHLGQRSRTPVCSYLPKAAQVCAWPVLSPRCPGEGCSTATMRIESVGDPGLGRVAAAPGAGRQHRRTSPRLRPRSRCSICARPVGRPMPIDRW